MLDTLLSGRQTNFVNLDLVQCVVLFHGNFEQNLFNSRFHPREMKLLLAMLGLKDLQNQF